MTWMERVGTGEGTRTVRTSEDLSERLQRGEVIGYADGSRMEGMAAGASAEGSPLLGNYPTVMDAEMVGIAGAWEEGYSTVATDSQLAIRRCANITAGIQRAESWIDEKIMRAAKAREGTVLSLVWVKGYSGVAVNEAGNRRAKGGVMRVV